MIKTITNTDLSSDSKLTSLTLSGINAAIADLRVKIDELSKKEIEECNLAIYRTSDYHNSINAVLDANRTDLARVFLVIDDNQQTNDGVIVQQSGAYYGGGNYRFVEVASGQLKVVNGELVVDTSTQNSEIPTTYYRVIRAQYNNGAYNVSLTLQSQWRLLTTKVNVADEITSSNTFWSGMITTTTDDLIMPYGLTVAGKSVTTPGAAIKFGPSSEATTTRRGLMSAADKAKLDALTPGLQITVDDQLSLTSTNPVQNRTLAILWDLIVSNFNTVSRQLNDAITTQNINKLSMSIHGYRNTDSTPNRPGLAITLLYNGQTLNEPSWVAPDTWLATEEAHGLMSAADKYKLDTLVVTGDVSAIPTGDDTDYPEYAFIGDDTVTPTVKSNVKANPAALSKTGATVTTEITMEGKVNKVYVQDPSTGTKYQMSGVGDTLVTDTGTKLTVEDVTVNTDSSQTLTVSISAPENVQDTSIETEYKITTNLDDVESTLAVSQAAAQAEELEDSQLSSIGYPIYLGFFSGKSVAWLTNNITTDIFNTAISNRQYRFDGGHQSSENPVWFYPKGVGVLWYAAPQGMDYLADLYQDSQNPFVRSNYVTNYLQWSRGIITQGVNNTQQIGTIVYNDITYVIRAINTAEDLSIVSMYTNGLSTQEANAQTPMINYIQARARFYRTDNVWISSVDRSMTIKIDFCEQLSWSADVDWITGCTSKRYNYYGNNAITSYIYTVSFATMSTPDTPRVGHLILSNGSTTFTITITQRRGVLSTSATDMNVKANGRHYGSDGQAFKYTIETTNAYGKEFATKPYANIETPDWITTSDTGAGNVNEQYLSFAKNTTGSRRQGTVTIYGNSGEAPISFTVTQDALDYFVRPTVELNQPYGTWQLVVNNLSESQMGSVYAQNITSPGTDTPSGDDRYTVVEDGVTKAVFRFHLNNRTLDPQTWRMYFSVNGVTYTEDIVVPVSSLNIITPLWVPEVPKAGDTLTFLAYTACNETLSAAFVGYRPIDYNNPIPVPLTTADEAQLTTTTDVQVTLTPYTNPDDTLGYNWYNGSIVIPASATTIWYAIVIGDGTRYSNGNLKNVRTFVIKQQDQ